MTVLSFLRFLPVARIESFKIVMKQILKQNAPHPKKKIKPKKKEKKKKKLVMKYKRAL